MPALRSGSANLITALTEEYNIDQTVHRDGLYGIRSSLVHRLA